MAGCTPLVTQTSAMVATADVSNNTEPAMRCLTTTLSREFFECRYAVDDQSVGAMTERVVRSG